MTIHIRPFDTIEEFRECVRFQEETWGDGFSERVPVAILKVSQILGGVAAGAFDEDGSLAGFVFGMTGVRDGAVVHWSDMLAVRPHLQSSGLGWRLKAYQRDTLLAAGVRTMFWTFDPLESKNAHLNLNKLGAVVDEYREDVYGQTDSPLHRGIGTDRFVPRWEMASERVRLRMEEGRGGPEPDGDRGAERALAADGTGRPESVRPGSPRLDLDGDRILVPVPLSIQAVKAESVDLAAKWRTATRAAFSHYLSNGYRVVALYRRDAWSDYLLVRTEAP